MRVPVSEIEAGLTSFFGRIFASPEKALRMARIVAENEEDGVHSHGLRRVESFCDGVRSGVISPDAEPSLTAALGSIEQWDGNHAAGPLSAFGATRRAIELARQSGIGCVALKNTNHWLRGGTYGKEAARSGCAFIGWTNTIPNLPPWGSADCRLGNNPFVMALPGPGSNPVVLDMALSQFSYGKLGLYGESGKPLPVPGGFDREGRLSTNAAEILDSVRPLPVGFWKGSALSFVLDALAAILSGGQGTFEIGRQKSEYDVSQVFLAIDLNALPDAAGLADRMSQFVAALKSEDLEPGVYFPGEQAAARAERHRREGVEVDDTLWQSIVDGTMWTSA